MRKFDMEKIRRLACLLAAACVLTGLAAGCGQKPGEGENPAVILPSPSPDIILADGAANRDGTFGTDPATTPGGQPEYAAGEAEETRPGTEPRDAEGAGTHTGSKPGAANGAEPGKDKDDDDGRNAAEETASESDAGAEHAVNGNDGDYSGKKLLALTFDDGPDENYTPQILDLLKQYKVKATFFLVGLQADKYPEMAQRIAEEGHSIGSHSWSHKDLTRLDGEALAEEITGAQSAIAAAIGTEPHLFRAPYGALDDEVTATVREFDLTHVRWNIDPRDWAGTSVADMEKNILDNVRPGAVVLLHSFGGRKHAIENTIELLPQLIGQLEDEGYTLVTVDELIASGQASDSVIQ